MKPLLEARDLVKHFPVATGFFRKANGVIKAVDGVSFDIGAGETLGAWAKAAAARPRPAGSSCG